MSTHDKRHRSEEISPNVSYLSMVACLTYNAYLFKLYIFEIFVGLNMQNPFTFLHILVFKVRTSGHGLDVPFKRHIFQGSRRFNALQEVSAARAVERQEAQSCVDCGNTLEGEQNWRIKNYRTFTRQASRVASFLKLLGKRTLN